MIKMNLIKQLLEENKVSNKKPSSQRELESICGVPQPEISRIANGRKVRIELETAVKLARGLGKPVEYVFPDY